MQQLIIDGGKTLSGTIKINGAKNSAVALLPAAILAENTATLYEIPPITDIDVLIDIIELLNSECIQEENKIVIKNDNLKNVTIPQELSQKLRASYYFMGALLAKFNHVEIYFPGGCNFGSRQIDFHLKGFESLGASVTILEDGKYVIDAQELKGADIYLDFPSVGATINLILAATKAKGKTVLNNAAKEPEIINVVNFLNSMGAKIIGAGTSTITIIGVDKLNDGFSEVIPDRIEAGTYIIAGALIGDNLKIENIIPQHISSLLTKLKEMNIPYKLEEDSITISKAHNIKPTNITTLVYPGFPTDLAQPITVLLSQAAGISIIEETIYKKRMGHVAYLNKMGCHIEINDNIEKITGPTNLIGTEVEASDLRAGATLFLAALIADGKTVIRNVEYILRGYANIVNKLSNVGAKIYLEEI